VVGGQDRSLEEEETKWVVKRRRVNRWPCMVVGGEGQWNIVDGGGERVLWVVGWYDGDVGWCHAQQQQPFTFREISLNHYMS
jgi:hypothetical protein